MPKKTSKLSIIPLGGTGEIGKNLLVFEYEDSIVVIDGGVKFPEDELLGIDLVIPDISYLEKKRDRIKGLFITHGHEDHIGGLPFILPKLNIPIYGTKLTLGLVQAKFQERTAYPESLIHVLEPGKPVRVGDFEVEAFRVTHSIPDAVGYSLLTPVGRVVYTGDFKVDYTPIDGQNMELGKLAAWGQEGILALLCDSTNAERPGVTISEMAVGKTLREWIERAEGKIIMASFASNVHRIQQAINAAADVGRKVCVVGRSMENVVRTATELGYLRLPEDDILVASSEVGNMAPEKLLVLTTGSQGEPLAALTRMATQSHRQINVLPGDMVIMAATPIPGNEKLVNKTINHLYQIGAEVVTKEMGQVHVSGHANQEEIKLVIRLARPRFLIPHHGEIRHQVGFRRIGNALGYEDEDIAITQLGSRVILSPDRMEFGERVEAGSVYIDGLGVGDVGYIVLKERQQLAQDGVVIIVTALSKTKPYRVLSGPDIIARGFTFMKEAETLVEGAKKEILNTLEIQLQKDQLEWVVIKTNIRESLGKYLWEKTRRRPIILPVLLQL
ncbi:putative hydrolase of the metallo-beta-lactamase superfamily [Desulfosporosinus orientis DSM 765]|uniref:Ribonuclease J n=1 Tax=Desulfosporosinus orientis (strain ATCC 19365 / DSM 765 / NCIMB 8382 / VKM B-1628 / Singapore I) TaxID=768706 RepID=G7W849_DESOD|nr:ribonuclease J [Desulfosporosinus orientis]AET66695.1 putative hydrolase of the metallo-beta-lactamase superfamily [Desulfosporosinus orientis DSM 765]